MVGIYKIEKDVLTLCYYSPKRDAARPTAFSTAEDLRGALLALKRVGRERNQSAPTSAPPGCHPMPRRLP
jgi:hypothetical protein